jgi:tetratricopeptide (TPR) repeat protein
MERGDWKSAETLFGQAVESCPVDIDARKNYAEALWHSGDNQKAITQLNEAVKLQDDNDAILVRAGEMCLASGEIEQAKQDAIRALDVNPTSASAWALRGRLMQQTGQPRQALADFYRALSYAPDNRDLLLNIAETYRVLGEPQRALVNLQTLADSYPPGEEPQQVLYLEGLALSALNRPADAIERLMVARERAQATPEILVALAEAELKLGQENEARQNVQQALAIAPSHAPSRALLERLQVARIPANSTDGLPNRSR